MDFVYSTLYFVPTCLFYTGWLDSSVARETHVDGALSELDRAEHRSSWSVGPWKPASEQYIGASWPANRTCLWNLLRAGKQGI